MEPTFVAALVTGICAIIAALIARSRSDSQSARSFSKHELPSDETFAKHLARQGIDGTNKSRAIWHNDGIDVPVIILRRGAANHRVLLPDGTNAKVPTSCITVRDC